MGKFSYIIGNLEAVEQQWMCYIIYRQLVTDWNSFGGFGFVDIFFYVLSVITGGWIF